MGDTDEQSPHAVGIPVLTGNRVKGDGKPVVRLVTEPGDPTIHNGDFSLTTPPPTGPMAGRRVLYFEFAEPKTFEFVLPGGRYNDVLFKAGAGKRVATRADAESEGDTQEALEGKIIGE